MSKISDLSDGGVIQGGDTLIAVRSGGNVKVTYGGSTTANIDGGTIDGTVIGGTTPAAGSFTTGSFTGDVSFGDNDKALFGAGSDLQIYHSGATSFITENGTGDLRIGANNLLLRSDDIFVQSEDGTANAARFNATTGVTLYRAGSAKLDTTTTGIDVTGTATTDGLLSQDTSKAVKFTGFKSNGVGDSGSNAHGEIVLGATSAYQGIITYNGTEGDMYFENTWDDASALTHITFDDKKVLTAQGNGDISFYEDTGTTPKFHWDASAEALGIGHSNPSYKLDVRDSSSFLLFASTDATTGSLARIRANGGSTEVLEVQASGNVGIGTSIPLNKLVVAEGANQHGIEFAPGTISYIQAYDRATSDYGDLKIDAQTIAFGTDNGAEACRIDSSQNLLVGTTDDTLWNDNADNYGHNILGHGQYYSSTNGEINAYLNRQNSDGAILAFAKDGSPVGSIGTYSSNLIIGNANRGLKIETNKFVPRDVDDTDANGAIDLGDASNRFKDLYLSGGVYAGAYASFVQGSGGDLFITNNKASADLTVTSGRALIFGANGSAACRIDDSKNLLVGKTSAAFGTAGVELKPSGETYLTRASATPLYVRRNTNDGDLVQFWKDSTTVGSIGVNSTTPYMSGNLGGFRLTSSAGAGVIIPTDTSGNASDADNDLGISSARWRDLYLSGSVYAGNPTNTAGNLFLHIDGDADGVTTGYKIRSGVDVTAQSSHIAFVNPNGIVGTIRTSGSATSYNTSSDQRLKENISDADDAGRKVDAIQVRKYDWKVDGSHQDYGMIAQELQAVAPEAVSGDADSEEMMGVDYSKLVPMLVKEIQSLRARVAQLETN